MMTVYTLTGLTGKQATSNRVIVFATVEARIATWRAVVAAAFAFLVGTAIAWPFLEAVGLLVGFAFGGLAFAALVVRSSEDRGRLWVQTRRDKARSDAGQFYVCGNTVDPLRVDTYVLAASTVPGPGYDAAAETTTPTYPAARAASPHASPRAPQSHQDGTTW